MKTAKKRHELNTAETLWELAQFQASILEPVIFNTMRILKKVNPGDCYQENYLGMKAKYGKEFYDTYQLLWTIGAFLTPKRILEIGTRTGISLCQLLSAHAERNRIESIVCVDPFDQWTSANLVRQNLRYLNLPSEEEKVKIYAIKSDDYFASVGKNSVSFDYILVDGDHSKPQARKDLEGASTLCEKGGVIVFDDISTSPGECALIDVWLDFKTNHIDEYFFQECMKGKGVAFAVKK